MNARTGLAIGAAAVTIALTAAAFWLSYEHLHDVAAANGLQHSTIRAWAWPTTVDLFIVAGELLILRASLRQEVDPWAIALTSVGSLGSIALNVAGVGASARPLEYVVAAVPPVAALLAFGALMRQVHEALRTPAVPEATDTFLSVDAPPYPTLAPAPAAYPAPAAPVPAVLAVPAAARMLPIVARPDDHQPAPVLAAEHTRTRPEVHAEYVPDPVPDEAGVDDEPVLDPDPLAAPARARFAHVLAAGQVPGVRTLRAEYNIGQPRAQRIRDALASAS